MGYYYAISESWHDEIAVAIRACRSILALADKIDILCGLMLAGEKPYSK